MKRRTLLVLFTLAASIGTVLILHALTPSEYGSGGFKRDDIGKLIIIDTLKLPLDSYYFAGETSNSIVLGNHRAPLTILFVNDTLITSESILCDSIIRAAKLHVNDDRFVLHDVYENIAYHGKVQRPKVDTAYRLSSAIVDVQSLTPNIFIYREQQFAESRTVILSKSLTDSTVFIPEPQVDGLFCTDGVLLSDTNSNHVVYIYYYRNEFILFDSTLTVLARHHTIDTISKAHISVNRINDSRATLSAPPTFVNKTAKLFGNLLLVQSHVRSLAKDEPDGSHVILDLYNVDTGQYLQTYYVPPFNDQKLKDFYYHTSTLLVLYGKDIITYRIIDH